MSRTACLITSACDVSRDVFRWLVAAGAIALLTFAPNEAQAQFDWGESCAGGTGSFERTVGRNETIMLGTIPAGRSDVRVSLASPQDVDVVLADASTGEVLVGWPTGTLSQPAEACTTWAGRTLCYSGYHGDQTAAGAGNEWIAIDGEAPRDLEMRLYGFAAGTARVDYEWNATEGCADSGSGSFVQTLERNQLVEVGTIPAGRGNVFVALSADGGADLDIVVRDGTTSLVEWPIGLLHGATAESVAYEGMEVAYSGYNGIDGVLGDERVEIDQVTRPLTVYVFAYRAGTARVTYGWDDEPHGCVGIGCPTGGPSDAAFMDPFSGATLDTRWHTMAADQAVISASGGWLEIRPLTYSVWFHDLTGPGVLTEVEGDFRITTRVRARAADAPMWPVDSHFQFGGLAARDPSGSLGNPERWVFSVVGYRGEYNAVEQKSTVNDLSFVSETRWFGGDAELRLCRIGGTVIALERPIGGTVWSEGARWERADLPSRLEVGPVAYSYTETPNLVASFDYFAFDPITDESECWVD